MPISRMQNPRQLYGLGSFVKKITRPLKKVFKSPIGKAAMLGLGAYGLGGGFGAGGFKFGNLGIPREIPWPCRTKSLIALRSKTIPDARKSGAPPAETPAGP